MFPPTLIRDACIFKAKSAFLTDGLVWQHFDTANINATSPKPKRELNIASDDLGEAAAYLIEELDTAKLWPDELVPIAPEVLQLQQDYTALATRVAALESGVAPPPPPPTSASWVDMDNLADIANTSPSQLRLPDGTERVVKSWAQALVMLCQFVINSNPGIAIPLPDKAGGKRNLLDNVPATVGKATKTSTGLGDVYVYTTYSAKGSVANMKHILRYLPRNATYSKTAVILD